MATTTVDSTTQRYTSAAQPEPDILLLHTTEGMSWPGYAGGGQAPHDTIRAIPGKGITVRRHYPYDQFAKALANTPAPGETNRRGVIQVELIGTCDPKHKGDDAWFYWPAADDVVLQALADYYRPILARYGIPTKAPAFLPYPASYGSSSVRMSAAQFAAFEGICGHQHAPENDHGDPGAFPIVKLLGFLGAATGGDVKKLQAAIGVTADGSWGPQTEKQAQSIRRWLRRRGKPSRWDRLRGYRLRRAKRGATPAQITKAIQAALGVTADGVWGPATDQAWRDLRTASYAGAYRGS